MTKFQKCVVVWLVYFAYIILLLGICATLPLFEHAFAILLSPAFVTALILTIVFCARKCPAKTPSQECDKTQEKQS